MAFFFQCYFAMALNNLAINGNSIVFVGFAQLSAESVRELSVIFNRDDKFYNTSNRLFGNVGIIKSAYVELC